MMNVLRSVPQTLLLSLHRLGIASLLCVLWSVLLPSTSLGQAFTFPNPFADFQDHVGGTVQGVAVQGNQVLIGQGGALTSLNRHSATLEKLGFVSLRNLPDQLETVGDLAFMTINQSIVLANISNPSEPSLTRTIRFDSTVRRFAVRDTLLFVALADGTLRVFDVSNPSSEVELTTINQPVLDAVVLGTQAYLLLDAGSNARTVLAVDVTNPSSPAEQGTLTVQNGATRVVSTSTHLYVVGGSSNGMEVVSIADPTALTQAATFGTGATYTAAEVVHNRIYLQRGSSLDVADVSDPVNPLLLGSFDTGETITDLDIIDELTTQPLFGQRGAQTPIMAFVTSASGLKQIDLTDPTNGRVVAQFSAALPVIQDQVVINGNVYLSTGQAIQRFSTNSSTALSFESTTSFSGANKLFEAGSQLLVTGPNDRFTIFDVTNPSNPLQQGSFTARGNILDVVVRNGTAFVTLESLSGGERLLELVDISNANSPSKLGEHTLRGAGMDVFVPDTGDHVYAAVFDPDSQTGFLEIIDISTPSNPTFASSVSIAAKPHRVQAIGTTAFVSTVSLNDQDSAIEAYNVSDPTSPSLLTALSTPGGLISDLILDGQGNLLVAFQSLGVRTFGFQASGASFRFVERSTIDVAAAIDPCLCKAVFPLLSQLLLLNNSSEITEFLALTGDEFYSTLSISATNGSFKVGRRDTNQAPKANPDAVTINQVSPNTTLADPVVISPLANDTDPDGDTITLVSATSPANGTVLTFNGTISYTPSLSFFGTDTFTYTIQDSNGAPATGIVTITVRQRGTTSIPIQSGTTTVNVDVGRNDNGEGIILQGVNGFPVNANDGTPISFDENISTLLDAIDATTNGGAPISTVSGSGGSNTLLSETIQIQYPQGFATSDQFSFSILHGTKPIRMTLDFLLNRPPVAVADLLRMNKDDGLLFPEPLVNDSDPDSDTFTLTSINGQEPVSNSTTLQNGTLRGETGPDGLILIYAPAQGFVGTDVIPYTITDSRGATASSLITIQVEQPGSVQLPITAGQTEVNVRVSDNAENQLFVLEGTRGELARDENGNPIPVNLDETTTLTDFDNTTSSGATVELVEGQNPDSFLDDVFRVRYANGFSDTDRFSFSILNGDKPFRVTLDFLLNRPPVAVADLLRMNKDDGLLFPEPLVNDSDPDSDTFTLTSINGQEPVSNSTTLQNGTLRGETGPDGLILIYAPAQGFVGTDVIPYTITDSRGATASSLITIQVEQPGSVQLPITAGQTEVNVRVSDNAENQLFVLEGTRGELARDENGNPIPVNLDETTTLTDFDNTTSSGTTVELVEGQNPGSFLDDVFRVRYANGFSDTDRFSFSILNGDKPFRLSISLFEPLAQPTLELRMPPAPQHFCPPQEATERIIARPTLTADDVADWNIDGVSFTVTGNLKRKNLLSATLVVGNRLVGEITPAESDPDGFVTGVSFPVNTVVSAGQTVPMTLIFELKFEPQEGQAFVCPFDEPTSFSVELGMTDIGATPEILTGEKLPAGRLSSGTQFIACVVNETQNTPFNLIVDAEAEAQDNNTLAVCPGIYQENVVVDIPGLTIRSVEGPANTIVQSNSGSEADVFTLNANDVTIQGFQITGGRVGVFVDNSAQGRIGFSDSGAGKSSDSTATQRNVIFANQLAGIHLRGEGTTGTRILGNHIGTDVAGTTPFPNQHGILIEDASDNIIGSADHPNIISGNVQHGVFIRVSNELFEADRNIVSSNLIGLPASGECSEADGTCLGNGASGIQVEGGSKNEIGDPNDIVLKGLRRNHIAYNKGNGVTVVSGTENSIVRNHIFRNAGLGIDLQAPGETPSSPTPNDSLDADEGPNNLQNAPRLLRVQSIPRTTNPDAPSYIFPEHNYFWQLNSELEDDALVDFYVSDLNGTCDATGFGEGARYLTSSNPSASVPGRSIINAPASPRFVTATITDTKGNTSEFSNISCFVIEEVAFSHISVDTDQPIKTLQSRDGNLVTVTTTIFNGTSRSLNASFRLIDEATNRFVKGSFAGDVQPTVDADGIARFEFPPAQTTTFEYEWDTSGFAWNDDNTANSDRKLILEFIDDDFPDATIQTEPIPFRVLPKPVILVHGLWSNAETWLPYNAFFSRTHPDLDALAVGDGKFQGIMRTGVQTSPDTPANDIFVNAQNLAAYIRGARIQQNAHHVDIVAHSMGGLISRMYINSLMENAPDDKPIVNQLIMLGTPNQGSPCADLLFASNGTGAWHPAIPQLTKVFVNGKFNRVIRNQKDVPFSILAGDIISTTCGGENGDAVVEVSSALDRSVITFEKELTLVILHTAMTADQTVFDLFVKPQLIQTPVDALRASPRLSQPQSDIVDLGSDARSFMATDNQQQIANLTANLAPGEEQILSFSVPEGTRLTTVHVASSGVGSTLRTPDGSDLASVESGSTQSRDFFRTASVTNPATGTWSLALFNAGSDSVSVPFVATLEGNPIRLEVAVADPDGTGSTQLLATLTDNGTPITGATVTAIQRGSTGLSAPFTLFDDGAHDDGAADDGVYGGRSSAAVPDIYSFLVTAEGSDFRRMTAALLDISEASTTPALVRIEVDPPSLAMSTGSTRSFSAMGFDQFDQAFVFTPEWSATGGIIDQDGQFTAGNDLGTFTIMVRDPVTLHRTEAEVTITSGVSVEEADSDLPTTFTLHQNYPNPFNPTTRIQYDIPSPSHVRLEVYNALGQRIAVLVDQVVTAGRHFANWSALHNESGVYVARMVAEPTSLSAPFTAVQEMVLLK